MHGLQPETVAVASGRPARTADAPLNPHIVLSAPFHHGGGEPLPAAESSETIRSFEAAVGALEGGEAIAFGSGMAATTAVIEGQPTGSVAVAPVAAYGGTSLLFAEQVRLGRMTVREVDITDTVATVAALTGADLIWVESPTNPLLGIADLPVIVEAARPAGATVDVDSTFNTPLVMRPLELGADVVMHSATKYAGRALRSADGRAGHPLAGTGRGPTHPPHPHRSHARCPGVLSRAAGRAHPGGADGAGAGQRAGARGPAQRASAGLPGPLPGAAVRPVSRAGDAAASRVRDDHLVRRRRVGRGRRGGVRTVPLITHATSLGGVESLIERRARYETDATRGTPPSLLRLSVGIEHVDDLWADLSQALAGAY